MTPGELTPELKVLIDAEIDAAGGGGGGGSQPLQRAYLRLTPSDLGQAAFTPFEIVAAPGASKVLVPFEGIVSYPGGTTPYGGQSDDTDVIVYYGDPLDGYTSPLGTGSQQFWAGTDPAVAILTQSGSSASVTNVVLPPNKHVTVALSNADPLVDGDSPLDIWLWFTEHDLTDLS